MSMWFHKFVGETNIDIKYEGQESRALTHASKHLASLLVLEGEVVDIGGDEEELVAYQAIYHSVTLSSTFLLHKSINFFSKIL